MLYPPSRNFLFQSIANRIAPDHPSLIAIIQYYAQDLWAAVWFYNNRRTRSEVVAFLQAQLVDRTPEARQVLKDFFNLAPFSTSTYSLRKASSSSDPFEQAEWLLGKWTKNGKATAGRGPLCPGELHPKIIVVAFMLALLQHVTIETSP